MNSQEAIASLKTLCHTCKLFPRCAYEKPECFKAIEMAISALQAQDVPDTNVGDKISKFIDGLEVIFADLRERHVDDSVCGLCEYDGAYMGQSGDWCNECPGFEKDDCFKLSDETRKKWTEEILKALPSVQPVATDTNVCNSSEMPNSSDCISRQVAIDANTRAVER